MSSFNWDSLDPDEPAAAETLAALDALIEVGCDKWRSTRLVRTALSSAWRLIRSLQESLNDGRMHQDQLEAELAELHQRSER